MTAPWPLTHPVGWTLGVLLATLLLASVLRFGGAALRPSDGDDQRARSLLTWWVLFGILAVSVLLGAPGVVLLMGAASLLGLREFSMLLVRAPRQRLAAWFAYGLAALTFGSILLDGGRGALSLVPMAAVVLIVLAGAVEDAPRTYVRSTGGLLLGTVTLIYGLGHAALLPTHVVPASGGPPAVGWFLYLVIVTELNDIGQSLVGRRLGRRPITPRLSPHKTWEGLAGGVVTSVGVSLLLAPILTGLGVAGRTAELPLLPSTWMTWPVLAGIVISLAGFLGDINMSGVKRFVGVKDSSDVLPGMGGILDRVDSLTLTAPCFFWLIVLPNT